MSPELIIIPGCILCAVIFTALVYVYADYLCEFFGGEHEIE